MNTPLIILFGSQARQTAGKSSDTDIAVLDNHALPLAEKNAIGEKVAHELSVSEDSIDVVDLRKAPPLLQLSKANPHIPRRIGIETQLMHTASQEVILVY